MLKDYFSGGFDLRDLTKDAKTNGGDGPIVPGDDAQDFSDEDSLAEDEGETGDPAVQDEDMGMLMQEGLVKQDEEDPMSVDLFGPEMSSQPAGQQFGADTLIALLGRDAGDEHGLPWSDDHPDGMFDELSPQEGRLHSPEDLQEPQHIEVTPEPEEPRKPAAELVKEWFPEFNRDEVPRFTEIFGTHKAELTRPVAKVPKCTFLKIYF